MAAILTGRKAEMSGNRKSVKRTGAVQGQGRWGGVIPEGRVGGGAADAPGGVVLESGLSLTRGPDRSAERKLYPILAKPPSSPVSWEGEGRSERVASLVNVPFRHPDLGAFRLLPPGARARRVGSARSPPRHPGGHRSTGQPRFHRVGRGWPLEDSCAASPGDPSSGTRSPEAHVRSGAPRDASDPRLR